MLHTLSLVSNLHTHPSCFQLLLQLLTPSPVLQYLDGKWEEAERTRVTDSAPPALAFLQDFTAPSAAQDVSRGCSQPTSSCYTAGTLHFTCYETETGFLLHAAPPAHPAAAVAGGTMGQTGTAMPGPRPPCTPNHYLQWATTPAGP